MSEYISYPILFWIFLICSIVGVLIEGVFCLLKYKHWETHTVTIWGPFCIIYGLGAIGFYVGGLYLENVHIVIQFLCFSIIATIVEYICGFILKYALHMKAWDYSNERLNFQGIICVGATIIWGLMGTAFSQKCVPYIKLFSLIIDNNEWDLACAVLSVLMFLNLLLTFICIVRWTRRHRGLPAQNAISRYIDKKYDDNKMSKRFCEWEFIDSHLNKTKEQY